MTKWEYMWFRRSVGGFMGPDEKAATEGVISELNEFGREGWEVAGVTSLGGRSVTAVVVFYLKRPLPS